MWYIDTTQEDAIKIRFLAAVARLLGIQFKVDGMPYGAALRVMLLEEGQAFRPHVAGSPSRADLQNGNAVIAVD